MKTTSFSKLVALLLVFALCIAQLPNPVHALDNTLRFPDLQGHYAESTIREWESKGLVTGLPDGSFAPRQNVTRAEFITLFMRAFQPTSDNSTLKTFSDVTSGQWFAKNVNTASALGIISGYDDGRFGPQDPITRQDAAVILSRFLELTKIYDKGQANRFIDKAMISDYALSHISAMAELSLISGKPDQSFSPSENITRADAVLLLNNAYRLVAGESGIRGKVYSGDAPLAEAEITLLAKGSYTPLTTVKADKNGMFISDHPAGTYDILVSKDNYVTFLSEVHVRDGYKNFIKIKAEEGQVVKGIVKDSGGKLLKDTSLYFKTNPYFSARSNDKGEVSLTLPKNRDYEYFYEKDGKLIYIGTFSTKGKDGTIDLGTIITKLGVAPAPSAPSSSSPSVSDSNSGNTPTPPPSTPDKPNVLADVVQEMLGLDKTKDDNDGDGLKDYFEFSYLDTDLLKADTDDNGISDAEEDYDQDGISNIKEQELGTRPDKTDTDNDGLNDNDELTVHKTSPIKPDTDEDGLTDSEELKLGLDPTNPKSDGITADKDRKFEQKAGDEVKSESLLASDNWLVPSLSGNLPGDITRNVRLSKEEVPDITDNRAVLSDVVGVTSRYQEPVNLSFQYTQGYNGDIKNLVIATYSEEEGILPLETVLDENSSTLTAPVSESGNYFVIDLAEFLRGLGIDVLGNLSPKTTSSPDDTHLTSDLKAQEGENTSYKYFYDASGKVTDKKQIHSAEDDQLENQNRTLQKQTKESLEASSSAITLQTDDTLDLTLTGDSDLLSVASKANATGKADIAFVLDTTGSMDDDIMNVAKNINAFVDLLMTNYNVDVNFSIITYSDIINVPGSTRIHKNHQSNWYTNVNAFKKEVMRTAQNDVGQGWNETPLDGLGMAKHLDWRPNATKFVILLTDEWSSEFNHYGYNTIAEAANDFAKEKICVSVITEPSLYPYYRVLWDKTNGLNGSIFENFSTLLLQLANKIGNITNADGEWVFLRNYKAVKLSKPVDQAATNDTDKDGLTDLQELVVSESRNMTQLIRQLLAVHKVPEALYKGKTSITVWKNKSDPTLLDTDFDGRPDGTVDYDNSSVTADRYPNNNQYAGYLHWGEDGSVTKNKVKFQVDYREFFKPNTKYHKKLAIFSSLAAADIYSNTYIKFTDGYSGGVDHSKVFANLCGLKNVENFPINSQKMNFGGIDTDDCTEITVGHREVTYNGVTKEIIMVFVRGTNGTHEEWTSNFDPGADMDTYKTMMKYNTAKPEHIYWKNKNHHKGFDVAANRVLQVLDQYFKDNHIYEKNNKVIFITGHSRAGGISNLLGKHFEDDPNFESFVYGHATPNTTTNAKKANGSDYRTIFNLFNADDLIPYMPLEKWNFTKYGVIRKISVEKNYENHWFGAEEGTWEWLVGKDYNNDGGTQRTLTKFYNAIASRQALYTPDTSPAGKALDGPSFFSERAANEKLPEFKKTLESEKLLRFVKEIKVVQRGQVHGAPVYGYEIHYYPAYVTQVLANMTVGVGPLTGRPVSGKYNSAKWSFIWSSGKVVIGGMEHPHLPVTYYLIASQLSE